MPHLPANPKGIPVNGDKAIVKTGIILINTGTPRSPDPKDIKPYLIEFLSDRHIIRIPPLIWQPILRGIVVNARPKKTSKRYRVIWTEEGSPFMVTSRKQVDALSRELKARGMDVEVALGMRYGTPSIEEAFATLEDAGCHRVVAVPLFPQSTYSTTMTCAEKVRGVARDHPVITRVDIVEGYGDHPLYLSALADSIADAQVCRSGSKILFAFHSIPLADIRRGDTYQYQVEQCVSGVAAKLGLAKEDWAIGYHSRFEDSRRWLQPHPNACLDAWAAEGVGRVTVVAPGFATDCLETLFDCAIQQKARFEEACARQGVQADFVYLPALNDSAAHIALLATLVEERI